MQAVVKLALANGMTPDDVAPGYMPLTIPADLFENNQNNFKTFKHLTEDLVGTLLPSHTMPTIEPKHKGGGFGLLQGIEIAVAVALSCMIPALAGALAAMDETLLGVATTTAAGTTYEAGVAAYAIAGAITSGAASIGNAMLEGKGVHWDMVGRQMLVGAATAGAGYKLQAVKGLGGAQAEDMVKGVSTKVVASEVLHGAEMSMIQQATARMVGLVKHIDFEQVAVSAAASGGRAVAQSSALSHASKGVQDAYTSTTTKGQLPFEIILMSNFAGAVSEGAMEHMLSGDRVYWDQKFYQAVASSAGELAGQYGNDKFTIKKQSQANELKTLKADAPQRAKASGSVLQARERRQQQYVDAKRQAAARRQQVLARHSMKDKQAAARADARGPGGSGGGSSPFGGYTLGGSLADARFAAAFDSALAQPSSVATTAATPSVAARYAQWYSHTNQFDVLEQGMVGAGKMFGNMFVAVERGEANVINWTSQHVFGEQHPIAGKLPYFDYSNSAQAGGALGLTGATLLMDAPALVGGAGRIIGSAVTASKSLVAETQMALGRSELLKNFGNFGSKPLMSTAYRTDRMLELNVGYNVSPESWFSKYSKIGVDGTYITDYRAIGRVIGPKKAGTQFSIGFFSRGSKLSYFRASRLEKTLGLAPRSLTEDGFRLTRVPDIVGRFPRAPIASDNMLFKGAGSGLPSGDPELVIDSIPTIKWPKL